MLILFSARVGEESAIGADGLTVIFDGPTKVRRSKSAGFGRAPEVDFGADMHDVFEDPDGFVVDGAFVLGSASFIRDCIKLAATIDKTLFDDLVAFDFLAA